MKFQIFPSVSPKMATSKCSRFLALVFSVFVQVYAIKDGSAASQCDYPGIVAVLASNNEVVVCSGVRVGGVLYVPELCGSTMEQMLGSSDLLVVYGDGTKNVTITQANTGTTTDGVYQLTLPGTLETDCNPDGVLYDSSNMTVDDTTCEVVGYGGSSSSAQVYDGTMNAASLTKSTSAPCCEVIKGALNTTEKGVLLDDTVSLNCVDSSGAPCGVGDLGAPIYCNTTDGQTVVMGLTASSPCQSGGRFLVHDLSGNDPDFKFGLTA